MFGLIDVESVSFRRARQWVWVGVGDEPCDDNLHKEGGHLGPSLSKRHPRFENAH